MPFPDATRAISSNSVIDRSGQDPRRSARDGKPAGGGRFAALDMIADRDTDETLA
jgi:hypothetical protein